MLLRAGADTEVINARGENPMQWAAWSGSLPLLRMLLAHGACLHARDRTCGWTPLLCAAHQVGPCLTCKTGHAALLFYGMASRQSL